MVRGRVGSRGRLVLVGDLRPCCRWPAVVQRSAGGDPRGLYEAIGCDPGDPQGDVERAARRLLEASHPDVGGDVSRFDAALDAWRTMSSPKARAAYDAACGDATGRSGTRLKVRVATAGVAHARPGWFKPAWDDIPAVEGESWQRRVSSMLWEARYPGLCMCGVARESPCGTTVWIENNVIMRMLSREPTESETWCAVMLWIGGSEEWGPRGMGEKR